MSEPAGTRLALSVVIPVHNEELNLPALFARLYPVLDGLGRPYEILFSNDGSSDRSLELLRAQFAARPAVTRVIDLAANCGQHLAILAAFERVRGEVVVTLDADLQNPPEEIPKLLAAMDAGHDCVGGCRMDRRDPWFRTWASRVINALRERTTSLRMTDHGCMLRAYGRSVVEAMVASGAVHTFIPALAFTHAHRPTEIPVRHEQRHAGASNYSLWKLVRLNFDLITGFSLAPLQCFTLVAFACVAGSFGLVVVFVIRRLFFSSGPTADVWFALLCLLVSMAMVGIGLVGEYVGRTYQAVRSRQRFHVREVIESQT